MVSSGLKKLASRYKMKSSNGVLYGDMNGYATTLTDGMGTKRLVITTLFTDSARMDALDQYVRQRNLLKEFRVATLIITPTVIDVVFNDTVGTLKKMEAFIDWFYPLLPQYSASGLDVCTECGLEIEGGQWKLINGIAYHMHDNCSQALERQTEYENEQKKLETTGSYGSGLIGALLGAAVGAIVWGIVLHFDFYAAIVGFLIGWLAEKGYNLLRGRQGKGKLVILIVAIILGVILGTFISDFITVASMLRSGELTGTYGDIPGFILYVFLSDSGYRISVLVNMGLGLLFAGLGVFTLLRNTGKEVSGEKIINLPNI